MALLVNIIGAGRLGQSLGRLLVKHTSAHIQGICNTTTISNERAITYIGQGGSYTDIEALPPADITFITTQDEQIQTCAQQLTHNKHLQKNSIIAHCSGALDSSILSPLATHPCFIASIHPLRSFAHPYEHTHEYDGTYCAMEGNTTALATLLPLIQLIRFVPFEITKEQKPRYHAAAVFASNYLVTLAEQAKACFSAADIESSMSMKLTLALMQNTLNNLQNASHPKDSLTGPIQRGDVATIKKHLDVLPSAEQKKLYAALGLATLDLAELIKEQKTATQYLSWLFGHIL